MLPMSAVASAAIRRMSARAAAGERCSANSGPRPCLTTAVWIRGTSARASAAALSSPARKTVGTPIEPARMARAPSSPTKRPLSLKCSTVLDE